MIKQLLEWFSGMGGSLSVGGHFGPFGGGGGGEEEE